MSQFPIKDQWTRYLDALEKAIALAGVELHQGVLLELRDCFYAGALAMHNIILPPNDRDCTSQTLADVRAEMDLFLKEVEARVDAENHRFIQ